MRTTMLKLMISAAAIMAVHGGAVAGDTPWLLRARAIHLSPADKSDPIAGVGAADRIGVSSKNIAEVDISYFFTPNLAAELVLTYPQKHDVTLDGVKIGTFKHLPPTLLAQYHFMPDAAMHPYLGAGINYTTMSRVDILGGSVGLDHASWGLALQAGADFKISPNWTFNIDVKKVRIRSDVTSAGATISHIKVDPLLFALGLGYRF
ncbi:OmpW family protein [Oxalobacteraceae bacterium]|nr:OmpW family protein [Oxalobacteraceae bacterium]